jgi:chitinase
MTENIDSEPSGTDERPTTAASRRTFLKGTGAVAATAAVGSGRVLADTSSTGNRIVGYYPGWASDTLPPSEVPYDKITHLNFAFLEPQSDGTVVLSDSSDDQTLNDLSNYNDASTTMSLSISGGWYPQEYSDAASTTENRQRFAQTAVDHLLNYGFDGIDLDWEYPDGTTRNSDPQNYELLIDAVRSELDSRVGTGAPLTIAASANPNTADDAYLDGIFEDLDFVNVMTYDFHGDWSNDTNFNAPLRSPPEDPDGQQDWNVASSMEYWATRPPAKADLVMGVPFYGRRYTNVSSANKGLFNSFDSASSVTYTEVVNDYLPNSNYADFYHHDAENPWLYSWTNDEFVAYDSLASISRKMRYVKANDFGGAMAWELTQDTTETLVTEMHREMHGDQSLATLPLRDHSLTTTDLSVREGPGTGYTRLDVAPGGTTGTVVDGPVDNDGYTWYRVEYDDGVADGWSALGNDWLTSTRFSMDHRTVTTTDLSVRDGPGTGYTYLDTAPGGTGGTVIDGPVDSDGYTWWRVDYDGGVQTGWSAQGPDWLERDY